MGSRPGPAVDERELPEEMKQEVLPGHESPSEKIPPHPIVGSFGLEGAGCRAVGKDMDKEAAARLYPAVDFSRQASSSSARSRCNMKILLDEMMRPGGKPSMTDLALEDAASHREVSSFSFRQTARALLTPSSWNP